MTRYQANRRLENLANRINKPQLEVVLHQLRTRDLRDMCVLLRIQPSPFKRDMIDDILEFPKRSIIMAFDRVSRDVVHRRNIRGLLASRASRQ